MSLVSPLAVKFASFWPQRRSGHLTESNWNKLSSHFRMTWRFQTSWMRAEIGSVSSKKIDFYRWIFRDFCASFFGFRTRVSWCQFQRCIRDVWIVVSRLRAFYKATKFWGRIRWKKSSLNGSLSKHLFFFKELRWKISCRSVFWSSCYGVSCFHKTRFLESSRGNIFHEVPILGHQE